MSGVFPNDGPYVTFSLPSQESTDNWVTLDRPLDVRGVLGKFLMVQNNGGNSVDVRVLGSLDYGDNYDVTLLGATSIASVTADAFTLEAAVSHIKVQITATSNGNQGNIEATLGGYAPDPEGGGVYPHDGVYTLHRLGPQLTTDLKETLERTVDVAGARSVFVRAVNENVNGNAVDVVTLGEVSLPDGGGDSGFVTSTINLGAGASGTRNIHTAFETLNLKITADSNGNQDEVSAKVGVSRYPSAA